MPVVCLINGIAEAALDPLDRGLQYGDGVFRTLRVAHGKPRWWEDQLAKLAADAARLGMVCPEAGLWLSDLANLANPLSAGALKLILTRGRGARGYRPPDGATPTRILIHDPASLLSDAWPAVGLNARVCDLRLSAQPRLAGVKHLNRLENVLARAEWDTPGIHEGLLLDAAGHVISGVMSNLFLWRDGQLQTPRLDRCGVAGVSRARLMRLARSAGLEVRETEIGLDAVLEADEILLCNSLIGLRRVARLGEHVWPEPAISPQLIPLLHA